MRSTVPRQQPFFMNRPVIDMDLARTAFTGYYCRKTQSHYRRHHHRCDSQIHRIKISDILGKNVRATLPVRAKLREPDQRELTTRSACLLSAMPLAAATTTTVMHGVSKPVAKLREEDPELAQDYEKTADFDSELTQCNIQTA